MPRPVIFGAGALAVLLAVAAWRIRVSSASEPPFEPRIKPPQAAPLCPWRDPANDLKRFFPNATRYEPETGILSGRRLELAERLGRVPTGDENALHLYRCYEEQTLLGAVLTRRVKGAYGAIELVLAVGTNGQARGLRLQRLRESEPVAAALQNPDWLRSFDGQRSDSAWKLGRDIPEVAPEARASAEAIMEGARSLLVLLATSDESRSRSPVAARHP
jgi:hypothetical protein